MIEIRRASERGHTELGWLNSYHTFSFGDYYDMEYKNYRSLRVINEDYVEPGGGFPKHPHKDMEIISYVLEGQLAHKDSMGNRSVIKPGEVQIMTAGHGVLHSEFNFSRDDPVHFLQIWIVPEDIGLAPSYQQKAFDVHKRPNELVLVGARDVRNQSLKIHQDADMHVAFLKEGKIKFEVRKQRHIWIHVMKGSLTVDGETLEHGDGAYTDEEGDLTFQSDETAEFLLFDLS